MTTGFDLSPVIDLLGSFSVRERTAPDTPFLTRPSDAQEGSRARALGDFSALWQYLEIGEPNSTKQVSESEDTLEFTDNLEQSKLIQAVTNEPKLGKTLNVRFAADTDSLAQEQESNDTQSKGYLDRASAAKIPSTVKALSSPRKTPKKSAATKLGDWDTKSPPVIKSKVAPVDKKVVIIEKLLNLFPETSDGLLRIRPSFGRGPADSDIHVFVDNSNILISFYEHIKKVRGYPKNVKVRRPGFSFHALSLVLERGRKTAKRVLVGSSPITREICEARDMGYETSILERVEKEVPGHMTASSGSESAANHKRKRKVEQAVDEILHLKILESILDYPPSTVVLASGDGAAGEYSQGFFKMIERCLVRGWSVEIVSFKENLNGIYSQKAFRKRWKDKFKTVALDTFAEELLD